MPFVVIIYTLILILINQTDFYNAILYELVRSHLKYNLHCQCNEYLMNRWRNLQQICISIKQLTHHRGAEKIIIYIKEQKEKRKKQVIN